MEFVPQNLLEKSLIAAADDPSNSHQFYKNLLKSDLFVVQGGEVPETHGAVTLEEGMTLQIQNIEHNGKPYVPVFSSLPRLQSVLQKEVGYVSMNALDLMKVIQGSEIILNPGSPYGKEFVRDEILSIIDGSVFQPSESFVAKKDTQVLIGQPNTHPKELIDSLKAYFKKRREVKNAYIAHFQNPEQDEKPHTLIGLEVEGEWEDIISGAGMAIGDVHVPDPPVDFIQIMGNGGIEEYFTSSCKPFYKKKFLGII